MVSTSNDLSIVFMIIKQILKDIINPYPKYLRGFGPVKNPSNILVISYKIKDPTKEIVNATEYLPNKATKMCNIVIETLMLNSSNKVLANSSKWHNLVVIILDIS